MLFYVSGYNISDLVEEAQNRWLKPAEVLFILQKYEDHQLAHEPPQKPASKLLIRCGSLFLFNKRVLRFFRKDGHSWRRKKDGRTVGEAHERLKVGNVEALNCYYAHGEQNPNFQRRSYWMLDPAYEHIVLVHYRDINVGRYNAGSSSQLSAGSSSLCQSPSSFTSQHPGSTAVVSEYPEPSQYLSSPGSVEVSSESVITSTANCLEITERTGEVDNSSSEQELDKALRKLEEQLSLNNDSLKEMDPFYSENENSNDSDYVGQDQFYIRSAGMQDDSISPVPQQYSDDIAEHNHQPLGDGFSVETKETSGWKEMLAGCLSSTGVESQVMHAYTSDVKGLLLPPPRRELENHHWLTSGIHNARKSFMLLPQDVEGFEFPAYSSAINAYGANPDYYSSLFDKGQIAGSLEADSSLTIAPKQKFMIRDICPEWGYASESTKSINLGAVTVDVDGVLLFGVMVVFNNDDSVGLW
ncbi:unnamed protein product [Ilex paraguariensis]|uniref:CG-1 domain-containing protein n=1 Tax=Ilex paraguariensis TaxID=185542 RepID=A0ABC8TI31_9AQUA